MSNQLLSNNRITELFKIDYPIIQAGMVWASGWRLASAVSNAGGLGIIGAGSMYPNVLREHIQKCKAATNKPFAVNIPLLYSNINEIQDNIKKYAPEWPLEKIHVMDRIILYIGIAELIFCKKDIPAKVAINESI